MAPASLLPLSDTVCVMDASGQLGQTLVQRLLQRGYRVHAAVQTQGPSSLPYHTLVAEKLKGTGEAEKLKVFKSDLFDYQSLVDALRGCCALIYAFEPPLDQPLYDEDMIEVEVRGAHNVLEACAQVNTIDKVVFTSSASAVIWRDDRKTMESDLDERHWSDINFCRKYKLWHALSKTLAEKSAWALARDKEINMVTINIGLPLTPDVSITHPYLQGAAEMYQDGVFVTADLDFMVDAQICLLQDTSTYGRYLCFNNVINRAKDAFKLANKLAPSASVQPQSFQDGDELIQQKINNNKLNKLMMQMGFADELS